MALGERFRSGGARGIARFLADHQHCEAGFDVRRDEPGSGRLRITCLGCGANVDYRAAEAGELAAGLPVDTASNGEPEAAEGAEPAIAPPPQPPAATPPRRPLPAGGPPSSREGRRFGIPSWVSVALIGALIIGGLTMVVIGVIRDDGEQATTPAQPETTQPETTQPAQPETGTTQAPPGAVPGSAAGSVRLKRRRFVNRFTIGVPPAWDRGVEGGAIVITAPGAAAELNVYFEPGGRPPGQLARAARRFLAQRHQGGQVSRPGPVRLGGRRGLRVEITYPAGEEIAVVMRANGFSYLVLRRADRRASPKIARQADAALASFRPR